jgi:chromosome segregation ATPase
MKEISTAQRLEVAQYYLVGYSYEEIEAETGVSHGSIANIVRELENGRLTIPGTLVDQLNDLRRLSSDLKKKELQPSQALLGLMLFERFRSLEITLEQLDIWAEIIKGFAQPDFSPKDFFEAAFRLRDLEESQGEPFETLAEEYARYKEAVDKLKAEVDSLGKSKAGLTKEVEPLGLQLESLQRAKSKLESDVEIQTIKLRELKLKVKEAEEEKKRIDKETKDLQRRKVRLSSEVDGKGESLKKLSDLGLSNEDLLRLTSFIERTSRNEGLSGDQVKERFFSALSLFEDTSGLENRRKAEIQQLTELTRKQSILQGEIMELEKRKGILEGEIGDSVSSTSQRIRDSGAQAASDIQQQVTAIKNQLNGLLEDTLRAGETVAEMRQLVRKGEESEKSLSDFLTEIRDRLRSN